MKRPDRILENSSGELDAPLGTRVRLRATTLEPASEASLQTPPRGEATTPTTVPLTLTSGRDVDGEFVIEGPGSWRFAVEGEDGEARVESTARPIRIEADARVTDLQSHGVAVLNQAHANLIAVAVLAGIG